MNQEENEMKMIWEKLYSLEDDVGDQKLYINCK